ncbi:MULTISPECIES: hypothetical protein [Acinetobacter]|jgi:hypothetical protein|uniref:hypothetical protein n=1 Tax=Acinetobacter TaxID=469 RepID=UPI000B3CBD5F|nr:MULTISPECIES: hypothetical protein [Acinetobacter]AXY59983.1 hypothetical protein CDG61_08075 [Acinetobacter sp. WCHAc010052]WOE43040.1 hypothetical protein QSG87_07975 [Acinetobacter chinensis]
MSLLSFDDLLDQLAFNNQQSAEYEFIKFIHENNYWEFFLDNYKFDEVITNGFKEEFHLFWIERGEFIRSQINDDRKLVDMLWEVLPPYEGKEVTLYRGENIERFKQNKIGLCWTSDLAVAKRFSTRNACNNGSIILSAKADKSIIITGTHSHSKYLDENEFTIDPFKLKDIKIE